VTIERFANYLERVTNRPRRGAAQIKDAVAGTVWRVTSAWIEQTCGTWCADLTHVGTGHVRTIRFAATDSVGACRDRIRAE